jgi:dTDP-4-amino-4,6-dideoxygalactose transaminase
MWAASASSPPKTWAVHGVPRRYLHTELGYNSRLDAIQASVLNVKLPHLERWVERRSAIAATYRQGLAAAQTIALPEAGPEGHSWNQFVVRVPACSPPAGLRRKLHRLGRQRRLRATGGLLPRLAQAATAGRRHLHDHLLPDPDPPPTGLCTARL